MDVRLEDALAEVDTRVTIVHAEHDAVTSHGYAASLATDYHSPLVIVPSATHSWPYADETRFATTMEGVLR
jgi:pimeloyl-ACP methyl ester carboxylesterase